MATATPTADLSKLRNIGVIAHIDAGKTTTTEHLLYYSGAKHRLGGVDEGTTETDYDAEEQERGITIYSAYVPLTWRDCTINLIDTPGHVDFTAEVERSLRVLDGAIVVFDAQKGVEAQSETVWRQADKYGVPRIVFVNKMDVVGANFENAVREIRERLEGKPVAIAIPIGAGSIKDSTTPFAGVIDLIEQQAHYFEAADQGRTIRTEPVPENLRHESQFWRERMFDALTERDEGDLLTSAYLEGREVGADVIRTLIREQTIKGHIHPVLCGSGREHAGIQPLLDAVCWYLPSPLDRPPVSGTNPKKKDKAESRKPDPKEPFAGLVFKVIADTHGELFYLRIYSGTVKANSRQLNAGRDIKENVTKLFRVHADPKRGREEIPSAHAGDIVAVQGMRDAITGDTLCDPQAPILLERITFAEAVVSQSVEPESSADKDKLAEVLERLRREDPTFTWKVDRDTGQTLMNGMGTLHLEIKKHRMERDYRLKVRVSKPRVSYRETLKKPIRTEGECVRQTGTSGLFARVTVEFDKYEPAKGEDSVRVFTALGDAAVPPLFVASAEQGIKGALESGDLGYPVMNVRATLVAVQLDEQLSNEVAFQAAGADAVHRALRDNIILLEPWMKLEVTVPEEYLGPVTSDLTARRGEIGEIIARGKLRVIHSVVPLAKMFDYADKVRSLSQGRASSTMEPHAYLPAPAEVLHALLHPDDAY